MPVVFALINSFMTTLTSSINVQPWAIQLTREAKDIVLAFKIFKF